MNLDTLIGWAIVAIVGALLAWHLVSEANRKWNRRDALAHTWATVPRDTFYDDRCSVCVKYGIDATPEHLPAFDSEAVRQRIVTELEGGRS